MAVSEQIIERIQKLLALAGNNPNEHEAASAAAKAQELMQQYDLQSTDVTMTHDERVTGVGEAPRVTLRKAGKPGGWKVDLFKVVGETSGCWVQVTRRNDRWFDSTGYLIGRKQDIEMADYLFAYLVREIERLQDVYGKTRWAELRDYARQNGISTHDAERDFSALGEHPLRAKQSWVKGAVPAVIQTLRDEKRKRDGTSDETRALVVNKEEAIRDFFARKRGYASYAAMQAETVARAAEHAATRTALEAAKTPAQKRAEKAAQRKAARQDEAWYAREQRKQQTAYRREVESMDMRAYDAGRRDGSTIGIRPGIK